MGRFEYSDGLVRWDPWPGPVTPLNGTFYMEDPQPPEVPSRAFRVVLP